MSQRAKRMVEAALCKEKDQPNTEKENVIPNSFQRENEDTSTFPFFNKDKPNPIATNSMNAYLDVEKDLVESKHLSLDEGAKSSLVYQNLQNINNCDAVEQNFESYPENIPQNMTNQIEGFIEDDDDSIKDPNYESDSSSSSHSSSGSSSSSSSSLSESSDPQRNADSAGRLPVKRQLDTEGNSSISINEPGSEVIGPSKDVEGKKSRKRIRKEAEWIKPKTKLLRNLGKEYVSCSKSKKLIPSKSVQAGCTDKCKFKCSQKIGQDDRVHIFNEFYTLTDINRKREFINRNMETIQPKYRYPNPNNRRLNNAFYFQVNQQKIRVCKLFFKRTLNINDRTIDTVVKKRTSTGSVSEDRRGKHGKHRKVDSNIKNDIREHIKSIPKIESHYLRAQTTRDFIEGDKSVADLHRDYETQCKLANKPFGNYHLYSDIFNTEFNISFFIPKKDQCNFCFLYNNASEAEKQNLEVEYRKHQEEKILSRSEKENDKKKCGKNVIVACFDMQAVFQLPKGDTSIFYYRSKLNTMNLTITGLAEDDTWCFVWHEGEGGKGVTEVASCILTYLEQKAEAANSEDLEILLYSDNCSAQQKNRFLIAALIYAVQKFKIKRIMHKFLIVGHTQNEGDSTHSVIEKQVKRSLKAGPIYVPDQFIQIIRNAKKKGQPYRVKELTHENFVNVKQLMTDLGPNFNINSDGEQIPINDLRVVKVEKEEPFKFFYKTSFNQPNFKSVDILKRPRSSAKRSQPMLTSQPQLPTLKKAYSSKVQLNEKKREDLQFLVKKGYIPKYYQVFYNSIC